MAYFNAKKPPEPNPDPNNDDFLETGRDILEMPGTFLGGVWQGLTKKNPKSPEQWLNDKEKKRRGYAPSRPKKRTLPQNWLQRLM